MSVSSALKVGRTSTGYRIRVEGSGTFRESRAIERFAAEVAENGPFTLVLDLAGCDYLDSTFLGCIVGLTRNSNTARPAFAVLAPSLAVQKLFKAMRLDSIIVALQEGLPISGEWETIPPAVIESQDLSRHMMECHRRLADLGGPQQAAFARIADRFEQELRKGS